MNHSNKHAQGLRRKRKYLNMIMKSAIYYFSGTGNSLWVAKEIHKKLKESSLVPIAKYIQDDQPVTSSQEVGFIFPLYAFGLPKIVSDFVKKLKLNNTTYIFAIITKAGELNGAPLIQLERILRGKLKNLNSGFFLQLLTNFIIKAPTISEKEIKNSIRKAKEEIQLIVDNVIRKNNNLDVKFNDKKLIFLEKKNLIFQNNVNDVDRRFFFDNNCNSCGICEKICPVNNIILKEGKPQWQHKCQMCLACLHFCPTCSIQHGNTTISRPRYHHPYIKMEEIMAQKKNYKIKNS